MDSILSGICNVYTPTSQQFYDIFYKLCNENTNENINAFLNGKSIEFKYLEYIKEQNLVDKLDLKFLNENKLTIMNAIIISDFDMNKVYDYLKEYIKNSRNHNVIEYFVNICLHCIPSLIGKTFLTTEKYKVYICLKLCFDCGIKKYYSYDDDFEDNELLEQCITFYNELSSDCKLIKNYMLTPKMYDELFKRGIDLSKLRYSSNYSNLLLFIGETGNSIDMLKHLVNNYGYDINYKNGIHRDILSYTKDTEMIAEIKRIMKNEKNKPIVNPLLEQIENLKTTNEQLQNKIKELELINEKYNNIKLTLQSFIN